MIAKYITHYQKKKKTSTYFKKYGQKTIFSPPKKANSRMSMWQKVSIFESIVDLRTVFLARCSWKKKSKLFPQLALKKKV